MWKLFTDPDSYFRSMGEPRLRGPFLAVSFLAVLGIVSAVVYADRVSANLSGGVRTVTSISALISGGITGLLVPFFAWFFFAGALHTVAYRFSQASEFRKTFAYVGYSLVPFALFRMIYVGAVVVALVSTSPPESVEALSQFDRAVDAHPLHKTLRWISPVFYCWTAFIWVFAIRASYGFTRREALKVVAYVVTPMIASYAVFSSGLVL